MEKYLTKDRRVCHIFYSLGNFISGQRFSFRMPSGAGRFSTKDSVIVNLYLSKSRGKISKNFELLPIRTVNEDVKRGKKWFRKIQVVYIPERISELITEMINSDGKKKNELVNKIKHLNTRVDIIKRILFQKKNIDEVKIKY